MRRVGIGLCAVVITVTAGPALGAESPGASPAATPRVPGAWFAGLEPGMCFNDAWAADDSWDYATPPLLVPCDERHDNEIVAVVPIATEAFPEEDLSTLAPRLCAPEHEAFLGRPADDALIHSAQFWPDEADWDAGARDVVCVVWATGGVPGTARSGSLTAPDEELAVYHEVEQAPGLWLLDGTGAKVRNLTEGIGPVPIVDPAAWTPDGSALVFAAEAQQGAGGDIHRIPYDGGELTTLVALPRRQDGAVYSPDGGKLAWISTADSEDYDIYVTDLTAGTVRRLTRHPGRDASPDWSPDGGRIAFRRVTDDVSDIWVMGADGSDPVRLTSGDGQDYDPRWSPDGSSLLFTSNRTGDHDIWIMDADGSNQRQLTTHPGDDEFPAWSSDGELIAFHSTRHGGVTLWLMRADGSDQSQLGQHSPTGYPRFRPRPGG